MAFCSFDGGSHHWNAVPNIEKAVALPKQPRNWTKISVLVAIFLTSLGIAVTIILSNLDVRDKEIGLIIIAFLGYIVYNEVTKEHAK
jgi:hypothetical protein